MYWNWDPTDNRQKSIKSFYFHESARLKKVFGNTVYMHKQKIMAVQVGLQADIAH